MISMTDSCRCVARWKVSLKRAPFPARSAVVAFTSTQLGSHSGILSGSEISAKTLSIGAGMLAEYVNETGHMGGGIEFGVRSLEPGRKGSAPQLMPLACSLIR